MGKSYETTIKLGAELAKDFSAVLGGAQKHLASLGKEASKLKKAQTAAKTFGKLKTDVAAAGKAVASARDELARLKAAASSAGKPTQELTDAIKAQKRAVARSEAALRRKTRALERVDTKLKAAGVDTHRLASEEKRLARQLKRTQTRMSGLSKIAGAKLGPNLKKLGREMKTVTAAGAALAGAALWKMGREAVGVDKAMAKLSTIETVTPEQVKATQEAAKAWTELHGGAQSDYIGAAYSAVSTGITETGAAIAATEQAAKLATATFADQKTAMKTLGTLYVNTADKTKPAAEELERLSDVLAKTQQVAKIEDLDQLGQGFKYALPAGKAYKVQVEQIAAALGGLNTAGLEGSQAGTSFAASLAKMSDAAKVLKKYDETFHVVEDGDGVDYLATIKAMEPALKAAEKKGVRAGDVLTKAFGQEGMRAVSALRDTIDETIAQQGEMQGITGTTRRAFNKMDQSVSADLDRIKAQWDNAFAEAGKELIPIIKEYLPEIKQGIRKIPDALHEMLEVGKDIKGFIDSVGGIKTVLAAIALIKLGGVVKSAASVAGSVYKLAGGVGDLATSLPGLGGKIVGVAGKMTAAGLAVGAWSLAISNAIDAYREWKALKAAEETNARIDVATGKSAAALAKRHGAGVSTGTATTDAAANALAGVFKAGEMLAERRDLKAALQKKGIDVAGLRGEGGRLSLDRLRAVARDAGVPAAGGDKTTFHQTIHVQGGAQAGSDIRAAGAAAADDVERKLHDQKRRSYK